MDLSIPKRHGAKILIYIKEIYEKLTYFCALYQGH